jgi:hypothetical protein
MTTRVRQADGSYKKVDPRSYRGGRQATPPEPSRPRMPKRAAPAPPAANSEPKRLCACGCGRPILSKRPDTLYSGAKCRQRASAQRLALRKKLAGEEARDPDKRGE